MMVLLVDFEVFSQLGDPLAQKRYLHLGRFMGRHPWFARMTLLLLLIFILTPYFGYIALSYLLLYAFSPLVSRRIEPEIAAIETRVNAEGDLLQSR